MILLTASLGLYSALAATDPTPPPAPELPALSAVVEPFKLSSPPPPLLPGSDGFSYTYAELDYVYSDLSSGLGSQNGYDAILSWSPLLGLYVQGSYANGDGHVDSETYRIGAGYHLGLGNMFDLFGLLSYEHDYAKSGGASGSADGYELDVGARFMVFEKLEINGQLEWNHVDDDNFGVQLGTRYYLLSPVSVGATVETIDNDFRFTAGVRVQL